MKIILEDEIHYKTKIKDFGVDPVNKRIIATGDKLVFLKNGQVEKEIAAKVKKCEVIKYIKEKNQLFVSSTFFVSTENGKVYRCDAIKKRIVDTVFDLEKTIEVTNFTTSGRIIYIENDMLFSYDSNIRELIASDCLIEGEHKGNYKIFTSGENLIIKYKDENEITNTINIFDNRLMKIFDIKTENNHTFSKIVGLDYIAGTEEGEIEIWRILEQEMYNSIKISNNKITYIEKTETNYFIALGNGELIITDNNFKIIKTEEIFSNIEIVKICIIEDEIFVLGIDNCMKKFKLIDETNEIKNHFERVKFLTKYNIHNDYYDFFTVEKIMEIDTFVNQLQLQKIQFLPENEEIFSSLSDSIKNKKVCLIKTDIFESLKPSQIFEYWKEKGAIFLNLLFTFDEENEELHRDFWEKLAFELINYIKSKNKSVNFIYFENEKFLDENNYNILKNL